MFKLLKLPVESANTEAGKEPPVVGLMAIVKPVIVVDAHVVGELVGGMVVFTMNMPSSRIGLKITCSAIAGFVGVPGITLSGKTHPNWLFAAAPPGHTVEPLKQIGLALTERSMPVVVKVCVCRLALGPLAKIVCGAVKLAYCVDPLAFQPLAPPIFQSQMPYSACAPGE